MKEKATGTGGFFMVLCLILALPALPRRAGKSQIVQHAVERRDKEEHHDRGHAQPEDDAAGKGYEHLCLNAGFRKQRQQACDGGQRGEQYRA